MNSVTCSVCNKVFTECFSAETNQAYGCASDYSEKIIQCHYGSKFDTDRYNLKNVFLPHSEGVICDDCIENLIVQGYAFKDNEYNYFAPLDFLIEHQQIHCRLHTSEVSDSNLQVSQILNTVCYNVQSTNNSFKTDDGNIFYWNIKDCEDDLIGHVVFEDNGNVMSVEFLNDSHETTVSYRWICPDFRDYYKQHVLRSEVEKETTEEGFEYIDLEDIQEILDKLSQSYLRQDLERSEPDYQLLQDVFFKMNKKTKKVGSISEDVSNIALPTSLDRFANPNHSSRFSY